MFCFSSEYHNSLAKMFKIPDFDDDVPTTDVNYNKNSTTQNGKVTKASNKQNTKVKKKIEKTANNSIVKAKDKISCKNKSKVQNNVQVNNNSRNSLTKEQTESNENRLKPNKSESVKKAPQNVAQTDKPVPNVSNKNKKKKFNKNDSNESSMEWLETENSVPGPKKKKSKQKNYFEDFDEELLKAGNKKFNESIRKDDQEAQLQFKSHKPLTKKDKLKNMLMMGSSNRNSIKIINSSLRERMLQQLRSAQFRYLNEKLYTSSGREAQELFQSDPDAFRTYHQGYQQQLRKWPVNPLDVIVKRIKSFPKSHVIADLGCGEAALSRRVPNKVRSFDLVATSPGVEACDMAHTPLETASVDVVVYCLALMGTELTSYLIEANRILKVGGHLLIAEVESRFDSVDAFTRGIEQLGFKLKKMDQSHRVFFFFEFAKARGPPAKKAKLPQLTLKPCIYKRR